MNHHKYYVVYVYLILTLLNSCFLGGNCHAQETTFFTHITSRDGLPSNIVTSIAQDPYDFIWVGTGSGLARYDGNTFWTFRKTSIKKSLPSDEISVLLADGDMLWVGTWNGLCRMNVKTFEMEPIPLDHARAIRALYKDRRGQVWIGTNDGLLSLNPDDMSFRVYTHTNSALSHNTIRSLWEDTSGSLWAGTYDGLNRLNPKTQQFEVINLRGKSPSSPENNLILAICPQWPCDSLLWIGTENGLYQLNRRNRKSEKYEPKPWSNPVVKTIYTSPAGDLWLGTDFGLNCYNVTTGKHTTYFSAPQHTYSLSGNVIWQIFRDRSGLIWLVTSNGLSTLNPAAQYFVYHEMAQLWNGQHVGNQVKTLLTARDGCKWLGTQHGVIRIDQAGNQRAFSTQSENALILNNVYDLEEDHTGRIWIGTAGGINIWNPEKETMSAISADTINGLRSNYISTFTPAGNDLWLSAWEGGLYRIVDGMNHPESLYFEAVPGFENGAEKMVYGAGAIWVIHAGDLYQINPQTLENTPIQSFNQLPERQTIYALYFSRAGHLWASTPRGLIEHFPESGQSVFHPLPDHQDVTINALTEDFNGNIWGVSDRSMYQISIPSGKIASYPLEQNLPIHNFHNGCVARSAKELLFGGDNGYISFSPEKLHPITFQPHVYITALEINNQLLDEILPLTEDISFTHALDLDYSHRSITFKFAALQYWQPEANTFSYKLEGFDTKWKQASGKQNMAVYSNLPAGTYCFRVQGANNDRITDPSEAILTLTIRPPLLLSKGFIVLYMLLAAGLLFLSLRYYSTRIQLKNTVHIYQLEQKHALELSQTKEAFFTNISHELRTPISLILPPLREIQKNERLDTSSQRLLALAEKNATRLLKLVNQILDFNKLPNTQLTFHPAPVNLLSLCQESFDLFQDQAHRYGIQYMLEGPEGAVWVWVDGEKMESVILNLLSNAFKFTPESGTITLQIREEAATDTFPKGAVTISVSDNGIGIAQEELTEIFNRFYQTKAGRQQRAGSGIGLTLAAEYVRLHRGSIDVISTPGVGSAFTVRLPLGIDHVPENLHEHLSPKRISPGPISASAGNLTGALPTLLLVEDNPDLVYFLETSLGDKYRFIWAADGKDALEKVDQFAPQLILSDIMMPVMDGLEFCTKIKENPTSSHIPLILLTAKSLDTHQLEGIRCGADLYLTKPFDPELLEAHIHNLLHRQHVLNHHFRKTLLTEPETPQLKDNQDARFLKKVMTSIETHSGDPDFGVEVISQEIGMSTTHLYRRLKAIAGQSAQDMIKSYRIKKAGLLLANNEGNIAEIMFRVGFSSPSYFSKCFKAEFGIAPKEYQQKMNEQAVERYDDLRLQKYSTKKTKGS